VRRIVTGAFVFLCGAAIGWSAVYAISGALLGPAAVAAGNCDFGPCDAEKSAFFTMAFVTLGVMIVSALVGGLLAHVLWAGDARLASAVAAWPLLLTAWIVVIAVLPLLPKNLSPLTRGMLWCLAMLAVFPLARWAGRRWRSGRVALQSS
jgi:hypothetical protein